MNWKANLLGWDVLCSDSMLDRVGLRIGWKELSAVISLHTNVEESIGACLACSFVALGEQGFLGLGK